MKITLRTTIEDALSILNSTVASLSGEKFTDGFSNFHKLVEGAIKSITLPKELRFTYWRISYYVNWEEFDLFHYTKDIKEDGRFSKTFGSQRGKINSITFCVEDKYYVLKTNTMIGALIGKSLCPIMIHLGLYRT